MLIASLADYLRTALAAAEAERVRFALGFAEAHEDCLWRTCLEGHFTGSAWIVDPRRERALLVHHRKLGRWLQPGGHADGDGDLAAVALREAREETGLAAPRLVSPGVFDFDAHRIPARGAEPEHWHLDVRFLVEADLSAPLGVSEESHAVRWFTWSEIRSTSPEESIRRLVEKTPSPGHFHK